MLEVTGAKMCTGLPSQQVRVTLVSLVLPRSTYRVIYPYAPHITSELLERIVAGYREGDWDTKLKVGQPDLTSRAAMARRPPSTQGRGSGWYMYTALSAVEPENARTAGDEI
jgi:hypothetical protein